MTSSPALNSDAASRQSQAFDLLHEKVRRWVWNKGWDELRDAQELAIEPILSSNTDVIISAATASGKTEAAYLPICSSLIDFQESSVAVLNISPLKALINDQYDRLCELCEHLDIQVTAWHGDISSSQKHKILKEPSGILLITPESLEALFVTRGTAIPVIFKDLKYIVVDELHSFIGTERGRQLQSLMHRLEHSIGRTVPRVALSATLGNMELAAQYLRPSGKYPVKLIVSKNGNQEIQLQIRGYRVRSPLVKPISSDEPEAEDESDGSHIDIAKHLFKTLRGHTNLIFANRRADVEIYSDLLRRLCEHAAVPNEFYPHHGSLSKELREDVERMLKERDSPTTAVCTTTLEMGIDVGAVESVTQLGPPPTVAGLRQRLGRSGRRGEPAVIRIYVREREIGPNTSIIDQLRPDLVQSIAMVNLLLKGWYEPPIVGRLHLSTLIQQVLSLIAQYGGVSASKAWQLLCRDGPFNQVDQSLFADLLRSIGEHDLVTQAGDGTLILGLAGENLVNHYSFYAAFSTAEEYLILNGSETLGTLPIDFPLFIGHFLIFGGRRWQVVSVENDRKTVEVKPAKGGKPPLFGGGIGHLAGMVHREMRAVYLEDSTPSFLDDVGIRLLAECRDNFTRLGLNKTRLLQVGDDLLVFTWSGDQVNDTIMSLLNAVGVDVMQTPLALQVLRMTVSDFHQMMGSNKFLSMADTDLVDRQINLEKEKHERFLSDRLLKAEVISRHCSHFEAVAALKESLSDNFLNVNLLLGGE